MYSFNAFCFQDESPLVYKCRRTREMTEKNDAHGSSGQEAAYLWLRWLNGKSVYVPRDLRVNKTCPNGMSYMLLIRFKIAPVPSRFIFHRHCSSTTAQSIKKQMANQQPPWTLPARQAEEPVLKLYNSLTR